MSYLQPRDRDRDSSHERHMAVYRSDRQRSRSRSPTPPPRELFTNKNRYSSGRSRQHPDLRNNLRRRRSSSRSKSPLTRIYDHQPLENLAASLREDYPQQQQQQQRRRRSLERREELDGISSRYFRSRSRSPPVGQQFGERYLHSVRFSPPDMRNNSMQREDYRIRQEEEEQERFRMESQYLVAATQNNDYSQENTPIIWKTAETTKPPEDSTAKRQDALNAIPIFNPDNPDLNARQWINIIDKVGEENKWTEDELKFILVSKVAGSAKQWHLNARKMKEPWCHLKRSFINAFPCDMDYFKFLTSMVQRLKLTNESLSTYFMHKIVLMNNCEIFGRKAVSCLIGGLGDGKEYREAKEEALNKNFSTTDDLIVFLNNYNVAPASGSKFEDQQTVLQQQPTTESSSVNKICYICKKVGHYHRNCPVAKSPQISTTSITSSQRFNNPKYHLEVAVNGIVLSGYNDLSTNLVTIREDDATRANVSFRRNISVIRGFANASITSLGEARVLLRVDKVVLLFPVHIVPNSVQQEVSVVIGNEFRLHQDVEYCETGDGVSFKQRVAAVAVEKFTVGENSSFSANERLLASFNAAVGPCYDPFASVVTTTAAAASAGSYGKDNGSVGERSSGGGNKSPGNKYKKRSWPQRN